MDYVSRVYCISTKKYSAGTNAHSYYEKTGKDCFIITEQAGDA